MQSDPRSDPDKMGCSSPIYEPAEEKSSGCIEDDHENDPAGITDVRQQVDHDISSIR